MMSTADALPAASVGWRRWFRRDVAMEKATRPQAGHGGQFSRGVGQAKPTVAMADGRSVGVLRNKTMAFFNPKRWGSVIGERGVRRISTLARASMGG